MSEYSWSADDAAIATSSLSYRSALSRLVLDVSDPLYVATHNKEMIGMMTSIGIGESDAEEVVRRVSCDGGRCVSCDGGRSRHRHPLPTVMSMCDAALMELPTNDTDCTHLLTMIRSIPSSIAYMIKRWLWPIMADKST
jgi:hypothetical protein